MSANSPANHYTVKPVRPEAHVYEVTLHIPEPIAGGQIVHMPAWIPGSYMIRDFAKNIVQLWAESEGRMLAVDKVDKQTWQVESCERDLCLRYEVYAWDLSVRAAHLDKTHAYFNGTSLFMAAQGLEDRPCTLELLSPDGKEYQLWKVATAMPRLNAEEFGFGTYQAANYDELIDHPVEIGQFDHIRFEACGVPHDVVITGAHNADLERIARDLKPICEAQIAFFGGKAPVDYYLFMVMVVGNGYGGLEHRASTSLLCSRDDLPAFSAKELSEPYKLFLGLCSHEYFHTWNVKRIKPEKFLPYDLRSESHTRLLWVFEGITSYYDEYFLLRAGLISQEEFLEMLGQNMTRVYRGVGRFKQSVADSSFDAWTKFYKQDENAPNAIVSYYTKGAMIALALDLYLRKETTAAITLDLVMQKAWERFGLNQRGVGETEFESFVEEVSGLEMKAFFDLAIRSAEDLPMDELLATHGIVMNYRRPLGQDDKGGKADRGNSVIKPDLGARVVRAEHGARIQLVYEDGTAMCAGLASEDVIIAVNGFRVGAETLAKHLTRYRLGERVVIQAFRHDVLMDFPVDLLAAPENTIYLGLDEENQAASALRETWLNFR